MIEKINPFIDNLLFIKKYVDNTSKIVISGNLLLEDDRLYFKGIRRYLDSSGIHNCKNIRNVIQNTYNHISIILQIPIIEKDTAMFHKKLKIYILLLDSFTGLNNLCNKYNIIDEYNIILSFILPIIHKTMDASDYL